MTATVTAGGITAVALEDRITALRPFTAYGPGHVRGVGDCIVNARRMHGFGDYGSCVYWLDQGACYAGLITAAEFGDGIDVRKAHAAAARIARRGQHR